MRAWENADFGLSARIGKNRRKINFRLTGKNRGKTVQNRKMTQTSVFLFLGDFFPIFRVRPRLIFRRFFSDFGLEGRNRHSPRHAYSQNSLVCLWPSGKASPRLGADFWEGDATKHFSVENRGFQWKGGRDSVNEGFGKDFYRKGNSVKRSGPFSELQDSENWKVAVPQGLPKNQLLHGIFSACRYFCPDGILWGGRIWGPSLVVTYGQALKKYVSWTKRFESARIWADDFCSFTCCHPVPLKTQHPSKEGGDILTTLPNEKGGGTYPLTPNSYKNWFHDENSVS